MKFLGGSEPWQDIARNLNRRKGIVKAAVSYLGPDAPRIMHLKEGDLLVCDASDQAIRAGSTSPHALIQYINSGVDVYSRENLHSKVIVAGGTAWVGSANASIRSEKRKFEATIRFTDSSTVRDTDNFIEWQASKSMPISLSYAKSRIKLVPIKSKSEETFSSTDKLLSLYFPIDIGEMSPAEEKRFNSKLDLAKSMRSSLGSRSKLEYLESKIDMGFEPHDLVLEVYNNKVHSPLVIVGAAHLGRKFCYWMTAPTGSATWVEKEEFEKASRVRIPSEEGIIPTGQSKKILRYFQLD